MTFRPTIRRILDLLAGTPTGLAAKRLISRVAVHNWELSALTMIDRGLSLSVETDWIGSAIGGKRAVFYEEMAEYSLRYSARSGDFALVASEVHYHINNLILLSMYFDIVLINTSVLFNLNDPFAKSVIQRTVSHCQFKAMMKSGILRVCGWGGRSPREMYSSAANFAAAATERKTADDHSQFLARLFDPPNIVYRSESTPDNDATDEFRRHLYQTEIIRSDGDLRRVEQAIAYSERLTGQLVSTSFRAALGSADLAESSRRAISYSIVSSWSNHLNSSIPGVYCYVQGSHGVDHTVIINGRPLRSFLYSPAFFAAFLKKYFSLSDYNRIMSRPMEKLARLRNGDWKRFCDAYHSAVETVSDSISHTDFAVQPVFGMGDQVTWGERIFEAANKRDVSFDIVAFIESLGTLSGMLLNIPFLGAAFRVTGTVIGQRLRSQYQKVLRERGSGVSPYINKVRTSLSDQTRPA